MDFNIFEKKSVNTRHNRVDRFIFPREYISDIRRRWCHSGDALPSTNNSIKQYTNHLKKVFSMTSKESTAIYQKWNRPWPCAPRKKTYLSSADSVMDLPSYSYARFPELLDWSKDNVIVAALGTRYHKWIWGSQSVISDGFTRDVIQCCKFDPRGELLLLGTQMQTVEIHNNKLSERQAMVQCQKHESFKSNNTKPHYCSITALDWSPTGNSFVTGCSCGTVISFTRSANMISCKRVTADPIYLVRVSPDARYVAVTAINASSEKVFVWPSLNEYGGVNSEWTVEAITWHPWRSALLGIGAITSGVQSLITVWNAPTPEVCENFGPFPYNLDAMLFSARTGELVVSLSDYASPMLSHNIHSQLLVLSDPHTVVDQWGEGRTWSDRVRTMVFNPDGSKLATATSDDDLIIWNFLPEEKKGTKIGKRRFSAIPVYLDEAMKGYSVR